MTKSYMSDSEQQTPHMGDESPSSDNESNSETEYLNETN